MCKRLLINDLDLEAEAQWKVCLTFIVEANTQPVGVSRDVGC